MVCRSSKDVTAEITNQTANQTQVFRLNQSQSGIYIDTGSGSAANTVIPANAGTQGTVELVLSWTPA